MMPSPKNFQTGAANSFFQPERISIFLLAALVCSATFSLQHHFSYIVGYVGASDGFVLTLEDIFAFLLIAFQVFRFGFRSLALSPYLAFALVATLAADALSLLALDDPSIGFYGFVNHCRTVALCLIVYWAIRLDRSLSRGFFLGVLLALSITGATCVLEFYSSQNVRVNQLVDEMANTGFRSGGFTTPTTVAGYLAFLLPIGLVQCSPLFPRNQRRLAAISVALGFAGIACTLTRGVWFCLALGLTVSLLLGWRARLLSARHLVFLAGIGLILAFALNGSIQRRVQEGNQNLTARFGLVGTALNMAADSPLIGQGLNSYFQKMAAFIPQNEPSSFEYLVHNKFLLTLAETGILGLLSFVFLLCMAVRSSASLLSPSPVLGVGLLGSFLILIADMNLESYEAGPGLITAWMMFGLAFGSRVPAAFHLPLAASSPYQPPSLITFVSSRTRSALRT